MRPFIRVELQCHFFNAVFGPSANHYQYKMAFLFNALNIHTMSHKNNTSSFFLCIRKLFTNVHIFHCYISRKFAIKDY